LKYYFAADVHLGLPPEKDARQRELRFVNWLDSIKSDAKEIFLLGDIFDFWFEYKKVVPKGFVRTLGKIAEITDMGIPVHFFAGNHDLWMRDYFPSEIGVIVHPADYTANLYGYKFYLAHGDAINIEDKQHAFLRSIFTNRCLQRMYSGIHPFFGLSFAHAWSKSNRKKHKGYKFDSDNSLYKIASKKAKEENLDFFVIGHYHAPVNISENDFKFIILSDWLSGGAGASFDENGTWTELKVEPS
jgi:UDP-2,3-diacylglucosamine hydrolase